MAGIEALLDAREARRDKIDTALKDGFVVGAKVNMPGARKNTPSTAIILKVFARLLKDILNKTPETHRSIDGDFLLFRLDRKDRTIKKTLVYLETNHPLGRIIDLDLYTEDGPVSRRDLGLEARRCFLCDEPANHCRREKRHSLDSLTAHIDGKVTDFLIDALKHGTQDALRKEVFTYPCFGLVSSKNNGIHKDMNISHFLAAITLFEEAAAAYLKAGLTSDIDLGELRKTGRHFERRLMETTGNINTHKGANFIFGLLLPVFIHCVRTGKDSAAFRRLLSDYGSRIMTEDFSPGARAKTRGELAYGRHRIRGVRGEMATGMASIYDWYPGAGYTPQQKLTAIMARTDDTTLMKTSEKTLETVKRTMRELERGNGGDFDEIHKRFEKAISPGGAADLLAVVYFLEQCDYLLKETP